METFSACLRAQCDRIWAGLHAHPFLGELARGTLPLDRFRFFIEQDLLFLPAFARCMAMGAAKSVSEADLEFFTRQLDGIIRLEIPSNRRLLDQVISLGAEDRGGARGMAPANVAYTSFLLATAAGGGVPEITAAILELYRDRRQAEGPDRRASGLLGLGGVLPPGGRSGPGHEHARDVR